MLVSAHRLLTSLRSELSEFIGEKSAEASHGQSVGAALTLLEVRERGGVAFARTRLEALGRLLASVVTMGSSVSGWPREFEQLRAATINAQTGTGLDDMESTCKRLLSETESLLARVVDSPSIPATLRSTLAVTLGVWEVADRQSMTATRGDGTAASDTSITANKIERYLRNRFNESTLKVTTFQPLPGGFGKQTILLEVAGEAISGSLVLRRDPEERIVENDCHKVRREFPVIRAAFERGFPAPEALWLDTEHDLVPGGDFIVMRRAPGKTGGSVFGSATGPGDDLTRVLADGMARLHTLPPCLELGNLTDSIRRDGWNLPLRESVHGYIREWYEIYLSNAHNPSPTLISIFGWLLANVPNSPGRPVLLHGDIGFHNMLIDEGRLSVLVDWEFAHLGDPAEDLGYVRNSSPGIPWETFMSYYRAAGGPEIDPARLHFFQVWVQARNAAASNLAMGRFEIGAIPDLKLAYTGHFHFLHFIQAACDLIEAGPDGRSTALRQER